MRGGSAHTVAVLLLLAAVVAAVALWVGAPQPVPPPLQLVGLSDSGRFDTTVVIGAASADLTRSASPGPRFPLVMAIRNLGNRPAQPGVLELSVPVRFQLQVADGAPLQRSVYAGTPLARYVFRLPFPPLPPRSPPMPLPVMDTLWLAALLPHFSCTLNAQGVPVFVPAPQLDPGRLARVTVFYSLRGGGLRQRWTGTLTIQLDSTLLRQSPEPLPPFFPAVIHHPAQALPELAALSRAGERPVTCGDPEDPLHLRSVLWETPQGGRFFVIYYRGAPRRYLFDLNRDSVVELEMWDGDGDGRFEARAPARYRIPAFLFPPQSADTAGADSVTTGPPALPTRSDSLPPDTGRSRGILRMEGRALAGREQSRTVVAPSQRLRGQPS